MILSAFSAVTAHASDGFHVFSRLKIKESSIYRAGCPPYYSLDCSEAFPTTATRPANRLATSVRMFAMSRFSVVLPLHRFLHEKQTPLRLDHWWHRQIGFANALQPPTVRSPSPATSRRRLVPSMVALPISWLPCRPCRRPRSPQPARPPAARRSASRCRAARRPAGNVRTFFEAGPTTDASTGRLNLTAGGAQRVQIGLQNASDETNINVGFANALQNSKSVPPGLLVPPRCATTPSTSPPARQPPARPIPA